MSEFTALAIGEEDPTTKALGEDDPTIQALGEEAATLAVGEEDDDPIASASGKPFGSF